MKTLLKSSVFPLAILTHVLIRVYFTSDFLNDPEMLTAVSVEPAQVTQVNLDNVDHSIEETLAAIVREDI